MITRSYSELITLPTFKERFNYLKLSGAIGVDTFGFDRYYNQRFYRSYEWKRLRNEIIVRDNGRDLAIEGRDIPNGVKILIHHMNPINLEDIVTVSELLLNPEYLITTTLSTHNAIHYGDIELLPKDIEDRSPNDTCPWKR